MGCPLHSHPAQLQDNQACTLCMECLKACPHKSVQFRCERASPTPFLCVRPWRSQKELFLEALQPRPPYPGMRRCQRRVRLPAADLWEGHKASWPELSLLFMLWGAVFLHSGQDLALQVSRWCGRRLTRVTRALEGEKEGVPVRRRSSRERGAPCGVAWRGVCGRWAWTRPRSKASRRCTLARRWRCWRRLLRWRWVLTRRAAPSAGPPSCQSPRPSSPSAMGALRWGEAVGGAVMRCGRCSPVASFSGRGLRRYMPMVWAATLAHYAPPFMREAGRIFQARAGPFLQQPRWRAVRGGTGASPCVR